MEQIRCENPNTKQREKKKIEKQTGSPRVENPSPWVSIDQIRCEHLNIKQRRKRKKKNREANFITNPWFDVKDAKYLAITNKLDI